VPKRGKEKNRNRKGQIRRIEKNAKSTGNPVEAKGSRVRWIRMLEKIGVTSMTA
jgi:hypothetical protein